MIKKLGLILSLFLLVGCSNRVKDMEVYYQSGQYLEAGQCAVETLKDPNLSPQTLAFIRTNGDMLLEKALYQADMLMKEPNGNAIYYLKALISVLEQMHLLGVPLPHLEITIVDAEAKLKEATAQFVQSEYKLGYSDFLQQRFRSATGHLRHVQLYARNYTPTLNTTILAAVQGANRTISLRITSPVAEPIQIYDIDVYRRFNESLMGTLKNNKSEFVNFTLDPVQGSLENTHYYVCGTLETSVYDQPPQVSQAEEWVDYNVHGQNGETQTSTCKVNYVLFTVEYKVIVYVKVDVYSTQTQAKLTTFSFERSASEKGYFRSEPSNLPLYGQPYRFSDAFKAIPTLDTLNRAAVTKKAIASAADTLAQDLLKMLDKDLVLERETVK